MLTFLAVALTFPTVVFGVLLGVAVLYWLIAATGLIQIDFLDGLLGGDAGGESFSGEPGGITGPLMRLGLRGVPLSLILSVIILFAWAASYAAMVLFGGGLVGAITMGWGMRVVIFFAALLVSLPLTALALRPVRHLFARLQPVPQVSVIGRTGIVRSPGIDTNQGYVSVEDGGAGLILQARSDTAFARGDEVQLVEYLPEQNAYRVVAMPGLRTT